MQQDHVPETTNGDANTEDLFAGPGDTVLEGGFIPRRRGVVLTNTDTMSRLQACIDFGQYDTLKVVTAFGVDSGWTTTNKQTAANMTPVTIVRSGSGDGHNDPPNNIPDPTAIVNEMDPWYQIKPTIAIEIGNEPNVPPPDGVWVPGNPSDLFIWQYRVALDQTIDALETAFGKFGVDPGAPPLIAPALAPTDTNDVHRWFAIMGPVMRRCHFIGFHAYTGCTWHNDPSNSLPFMIQRLQEHFPNHLWAMTEYGINGLFDGSDCGGFEPEHGCQDEPWASTYYPDQKYEKGWRYAGMVHFGDSTPQLPSNVWGCTYFHFDWQNNSHYLSARGRYHLYSWGDHAQRHRVNGQPPQACP